jgi:pantoate--beta-alanine ligase
MPLLIIKSPQKMQTKAESLRRKGNVIGLVPTMGAIHEGHLKLVEIAVEKADVVMASIFVNPTQFGPGEDWGRYPREFEADCRKLRKAGVDIVFHPSIDDIYQPGYDTYLDVGEMGKILEGAYRPGHFRGVATICAKLFNITKPHFAVFGQKDAQQLAVIEQMVRDFNFDLEIIAGPIVRSHNGVALSSRHAYLTAEELEKATVIKRSLDLARNLIGSGSRSTRVIEIAMRRLIESVPGAEVEYIAFNRWDDLAPLKRLHGEVLVSLAVTIGGIRLLDNLIVEV